MNSQIPWLSLLGLSFCIFGAGCSKTPPASDNATPSAQASVAAPAEPTKPTSVSLLNVSYDPTRELYEAVNKEFSAQWKAKNGQELTIKQSHGGSGKQARAVIDGLEADVVTLALAYDVGALASKGQLIPDNWQTLLPNNSSPYTSTIVFLVREGNPKKIKDWNDLVKPGIQVITPNPKTSGGARWNYLAAWGYALKQPGGDATKAKDFVGKLFANVPVLDSGARGALTTFLERGIGDVLIAWENEALLADKEAKDKVDIVTPSVSILAEPPVAVVASNAKKHGTEEVAKAYLEFLYTPAGQEISAKNFYRPRSAEVAEKYAGQFKKLDLFTINDVFGGWTKTQKEHFDDGGVFDAIYKPKK